MLQVPAGSIGVAGRVPSQLPQLQRHPQHPATHQGGRPHPSPAACLSHTHLPQPLHHRHGEYPSVYPTNRFTNHNTIGMVSTVCLPDKHVPQPLHHRHGDYPSVYPANTFPNHCTIATVSTVCLPDPHIPQPLHHHHGEYPSVYPTLTFLFTTPFLR